MQIIAALASHVAGWISREKSGPPGQGNGQADL
jgi:hypothetical protein